MEKEDEPPTVEVCEVHNDQPVFVHWGRYYCNRCKRWYDLKEN